MDLVKLEKTISKDSEGFCGEVRAMTVDQLKSSLSRESLYKHDTIEARDADEELNAAKDLVKEMSAPYRETLKKINDRLAFMSAILKEKTQE